MRVYIVTVGSRGDVQPYVSLGVALMKHGHHVTIGTHTNFSEFIRSNGLDFAEVGGDVAEIIDSVDGKEWMESGSNPIKFAQGFKRIMGQGMRQVSEQTWQTCQSADLIIGSGTGLYAGAAAAEKLGIPFVQAYLQPVHPTHEFPSMLMPLPFKRVDDRFSLNPFRHPLAGLQRSISPIWNLSTHVLGGQLFWQSIRTIVNETRRDIFKLPPVNPLFGPFMDLERAKSPVIYGFSPRVIPRPAAWSPTISVTGYWFLDEPEWQPQPALTAFLEDGPAPMIIGFGSMIDRNPEKITQSILDAVKRTQQRAILLTGWGGLTQSDVPNEVFLLNQAPHSWLFPKASVLVHHGGAGTSSAAFRSGVPSIVVPFMGDQPFWADRAYALGVAPAALPRDELNGDELAARIKYVRHNHDMRQCARSLGQSIAQENGPEEAVRVIEDHMRIYGFLQ